MDVSDEQSLINMYNSIKGSSRTLDIIVNNAGVSGPVKAFTNADYGEFKECVAIHLTGTFFTSMHGLGLLSKNGKIITISTFSPRKANSNSDLIDSGHHIRCARSQKQAC